MKLRLVVIDDEVFVRRGIISSINWNAHDIEVVGEAFDGISGLDIIRTTHPHIVITDIRMPNMDGLQLIRQVQDELPGTKFLVLSVLEEFKAVREALQLGVIDYIPKMAMMPEELLKAVLKIKDGHTNELELQLHSHLIAQTLNQNTELEQWILGRDSVHYDTLLSGNSSYMLARAMVNISDECFYTQAENTFNAGQWIESVLSADHHKMIRDALSFQVVENQLSILIILNEQGRQEDVVSLLQQGVNVWKDRSILTIGLSDVMHNIDYREEALEQGRQALEKRFYGGSGQVYPYKKHYISKETHKSGFINNEVLSHFFMTLEKDDEALSIVTFHELFPDQIKESYTQKVVRDDIYHWVSSISTYMKERGIMLRSALGEESPFDQINKLGTYPAIKEWCLRLHTVVLSMLSDQRSMIRHEIVKAMEYTKSHYMTAIRVKEVADIVHLSENYFSNVFTKETGKTFGQYLQEIRIEKAKELLQDSTLTWIEVGERIGFENPKYFTKVFKKSIGVTPRQYAESRR